MKKELLVPVGNYLSLIAAINNGADAVYLAGKKYGARAYSDNFTFEELIESKMRRKGLTREEAVLDILKTATKTRKSVNKSLGLE